MCREGDQVQLMVREDATDRAAFGTAASVRSVDDAERERLLDELADRVLDQLVEDTPEGRDEH